MSQATFPWRLLFAGCRKEANRYSGRVGQAENSETFRLQHYMCACPSAKAGGKASKPTEFGNLLKLQEAENQIVVGYEVFAQRPSDMDLLIPAIDVHQAKLGRVPRLVAADAGFYSAKNEAAAKAKGVKRVCIPNRSSKSAARKREQKKRWFRNGQRWRTGARDASASASAATVSTVAATEVMMGCSAGSASA